MLVRPQQVSRDPLLGCGRIVPGAIELLGVFETGRARAGVSGPKEPETDRPARKLGSIWLVPIRLHNRSRRDHLFGVHSSLRICRPSL